MDNSKALLRQKAHQQACEYIQKDDFNKATSIMKTAIKDFGPHVGLLSDLASCYYMLNDFVNWKSSINLLITEFTKAEKLLSKTSLFYTLLKLGNFYEELAQPNLALSFYEKAIQLQASPLALSSLARCRVFLNQDRKIIAPLYAEVINSLKKENYNTSSEIEHNLILIEASLVGFNSALARLEEIKKKEHRESDFHLILYDLYELALIRKEKNITLLQSLVQISRPISNFEKYLKNYSSLQLSLTDIIHLEKQFSLANFLQILALEINKNSENLELKNKLQLLLEGLSLEARTLYLKKWVLITSRQTLFLDIHNKIIANSNTQVSLGSKKLIFLSLQLFCKEHTYKKEDFVQKIYNSTYNESYHHRIRELVKRINQSLSPLTGNLNALTYNNNINLTLSEKITIKSSSTLDKS